MVGDHDARARRHDLTSTQARARGVVPVRCRRAARPPPVLRRSQASHVPGGRRYRPWPDAGAPVQGTRPQGDGTLLGSWRPVDRTCQSHHQLDPRLRVAACHHQHAFRRQRVRLLDRQASLGQSGPGQHRTGGTGKTRPDRDRCPFNRQCRRPCHLHAAVRHTRLAARTTEPCAAFNPSPGSSGQNPRRLVEPSPPVVARVPTACRNRKSPTQPLTPWGQSPGWTCSDCRVPDRVMQKVPGGVTCVRSGSATSPSTR